LTARLDGKSLDEPNTERDPSHFVREADHFAGCILENKEPKSSGEEGLRDVKLMMESMNRAGRSVNGVRADEITAG